MRRRALRTVCHGPAIHSSPVRGSFSAMPFARHPSRTHASATASTPMMHWRRRAIRSAGGTLTHSSFLAATRRTRASASSREVGGTGAGGSGNTGEVMRPSLPRAWQLEKPACIIRAVIRPLAAMGVMLVMLSLTGCLALDYLPQAAAGQRDLARRARDIDDLVREGRVEGRLRSLLAQVSIIK